MGVLVSFRSFLASAVSVSIVLSSVAPAGAAVTGRDGDIFFRFKDPVVINVSNPTNPGDPDDIESKSIVAYYIAGFGFEFEELLPLKPEWQNDDWRIVSGRLPEGITFDPATRLFSGIPSDNAVSSSVVLEGFDTTGKAVARARVNIDVVELEGIPVPTTLYAHTDHFKVDELPVPPGMPQGLAIESWSKMVALPEGVDLDNRYVQGTPLKAGVYRLLLTGKDYKGDVVATYYGKYVVEDGPTFPKIPDIVRKLPTVEPSFMVNFGAPSPFGVNYQVDPNKAVRYYLEKKDPLEPLPGTTTSNDKPLNLNISGWIDRPYDTATVRFKAIDSDGTIGYSNWFEFGSSDPDPICNPFSPNILPVVTGVNSSISIPAPFGVQGTVTYNLVDGALPEGLVFDEATGIISGQAVVAGDDQHIKIIVDVANGERVVSSQECLYEVRVNAAGVGITDLTDPQARHIRTGTYYDGVVGISGGIPDYNLSIANPLAYPWLSLSSPTLNEPRVEISGLSDEGGRKTVELLLENGDGKQHKGSVNINVHDELAFLPIADLHVKRLERERTWAEIPYDEDTVVPDVSGEFSPRFTFTNTQELPAGLRFTEEGYLVGATRDAAGTYGPFTATMTDKTGESVTSDEFSIIVEEREPIVVALRQEQRFSVEWDSVQTLESFSVNQPAGAQGLALSWTLAAKDGSAVPAWLSIDADNGNISAAAEIPFAARGTHGPFIATVTDADGASTSIEFTVTLQDWQAPTQRGVVSVAGNVTGEGAGEVSTVVSFPDLKSLIDPLTVIGGVDNVTFIAATPSNPAGLSFNASEGKFIGTPTEPYDGPVSVEFEDQRGRRGTLSIALHVKPYPGATIDPTWVLPRLANAEKLSAPIQPVENNGYWNRPEWTVDTTRGVDIAAYGLSVDPLSGRIIGVTEAAEGTVISGIVLKSTSIGSNGELLRNWTQPFSIEVAAPAPIAVSYSPEVARYLLQEGTLVLQGREIATPDVSGSYKAPLTWSTDGASAAALADAGLSLDPATGLLQGNPTKLGRWSADISVLDAEGRGATATLQVLSTLSGSIGLGTLPSVYPEWEGWPNAFRAAAGHVRAIRVDEPFRTPTIPLTNVVLPAAYTTLPYPTEPGLVFNPVTGEYVVGSRFSSHGVRSITIDARDFDDRTLGDNKIGFTFDVKPPLSVSVMPSQRSLTSRQYSAETEDRINVAFGLILDNKIGSVDYEIEGDLPGTAVTYDGQEYVWSGGRTSSAADLPADAIVFDKNDLTLRGIPSRAGTFTFRIKATDSHINDYVEDTATRVPYNTARTEDITITVAPVAALVLESSENPKGVVVPSGNGIMSVTPKYAAYGQASTFTVSGTLPPGITYTTDGTGVYFSGKFNGTPAQMGPYNGITVSVTDALGRSATLPVSFRVFLSSEEIGLDLSNIVTKVGYPVSMQAVADNFYGALRFYTYDLVGPLGSQLSLSQTTGLLSGTFASTGDHTINLFVTDATNRVTSKPMQVNVLPVLKVTVPAQVILTQSQAVNRTVLTDYKLGTVAYEKVNPEAWPEGIDINPSNGTIVGTEVIAASGEYPDLQIKATDTFTSAGQTYTDVQYSNTFSIVIQEIDAMPVISDRSKTILGTAGTEITPLSPTVVDDYYNRPWNYSGTIYTASHDLSQYGLDFDPATGRISGTPTEAFIIRDFTITVTSKRGDSDTTAPFWIGVAPEGDIVPTAGQQDEFTAWVGESYEQDAPSFDNVIGNLSYIRSPSSPYFDAETGVYSQNEMLAEQIGRVQTTITVVDEFGRTGAFPHLLIIARRPIEITFAPQTFEGERGGQFTTDIKDLVTVEYGTIDQLTFSISMADPAKQLPNGLTMSPDGVISGAILGGQGEYTFVVSASYYDVLTGTIKSVQYEYAMNVSYDGSTYTKVSTGYNFACGVTSAGKVTCWGQNNYGQLGNGTKVDSTIPVEVANLSNVSDVYAGHTSACAISNGAAYCWGYNNYGQLGTGDTNERLTPAPVSGMSSGVTTMFVNDDPLDPGQPHACAIKDGALYCWGSDSYGVLGNGAAGGNPTPAIVTGMESGVVSVGGGYIQTYASKADGSYWGWGWGGENRLGFGYTHNQYQEPLLIPLMTGIKKAENMMGLTYDGRIVNPSGNTLASNVKDVAATSARFCYIDGNDNARCTNYAHFQCPNASTCGEDNSPLVPGATGMRSIDASGDFACGINAAGYPVCWGQNFYGQLGDGTRLGRENAMPIL
jgi:Alpha-tubulin suppressor and related RCC1 domain-containing proteins